MSARTPPPPLYTLGLANDLFQRTMRRAAAAAALANAAAGVNAEADADPAADANGAADANREADADPAR